MTISDTFPDGLRLPQIQGAFAIQSSRQRLLADEPGAGKTAQAMVALELDGAYARPSRILILSTMTACQLTWAGELQRRVVAQYPDVQICDLTYTSTKTAPSHAKREERLKLGVVEADLDGAPLVVLANFDSLRLPPGKAPSKIPTLWDVTWDAVIIDESHLVLPTKHDDPTKMTQFWRGLYYLRTTHNAIRLPISGTPDRGKLENRYGTWKFMHPDVFTSYWAWVRQFFHVASDGWGGVTIGGLRHPEQWTAIDSQWMIRRTKREMLKGLPDKQWAGINADGAVKLPMTPLQREAYERYEEELQARMDELADRLHQLEAKADAEGGLDEDDEAEYAAVRAELQGAGMSFVTRARQLATCGWTITEHIDPATRKRTSTAKPIVQGPKYSSKLAWILEWLGERGYIEGADYRQDGGKVVIVSYFTEVLAWLEKELIAEGVTSMAQMTGDTSQRDKLAIEREFQLGELRIILLSGWLGVSINLDAADDMIFVDLAHDPDKVEQAEDRIHRASRNHQVMYWRLVSEDTIDEVIVSVVDHRYQTTRATYDGARGVEFARKMIAQTTITKGMAA